MDEFIIGLPSTNKDLDQDIVVVSRKWEFGVVESERLTRVSCRPGSPSKSILCVAIGLEALPSTFTLTSKRFLVSSLLQLANLEAKLGK